MRRFDRLADNERKIRETNEEAERIARDNQEREGHRRSQEVEFLCACGRADCDETILLSVHEYEDAHTKLHRFVIVPGHETPAVERVVAEHGAYLVVEKRLEFQAEGP
jgi:hypothetical protein